jgi:hypothetical protein
MLTGGGVIGRWYSCDAIGVGARDEPGGWLSGRWDVGGIDGAGTCGGYGASSTTFTVGATRGASETTSRPPQPPQNRESTSFSVPQVGQRIPLAA